MNEAMLKHYHEAMDDLPEYTNDEVCELMSDYMEQADHLMSAEELYAYEQSQDYRCSRYFDMSPAEEQEMMAELHDLSTQWD